MLTGSYSQYLLSDLGDLGWISSAVGKDRYIALLWCRHRNDGAPDIQVQTLPIKRVYTDKEKGKTYNIASQFNLIFSLLNRGADITYIDYNKWIPFMHGYLQQNNVNFCLTWKKDEAGHHYKNKLIKEICLSSKHSIIHCAEYKWPPKFEAHFYVAHDNTSNSTLDIMGEFTKTPDEDTPKNIIPMRSKPEIINGPLITKALEAV